VSGHDQPEVVASALTFRADPNQGLVPELSKDVVEGPRPAAGLLRAARAGRVAELRRRPAGRDAVAGRPRGRLRRTLKDLLAVLTKTGDERKITAVYAASPRSSPPSSSTGSGSAA
jgi:hypothetical protein